MNDTNSPSRSECMHISPITSLQNFSNTDEVKKTVQKNIFGVLIPLASS